jgi:polyadenylate-binding protein
MKYILTCDRIDDESALRAKVDEALHVYDEYMKNKPDEPEAKPKEAAKEGSEENKS